MSKLSDYIQSAALIEGNTTINNATGTVDIDLTSSQAYTIEQGAGDLTINAITSPDARAEGYILLKRNYDYAITYSGAGVDDGDEILSSTLNGASYDSVSFSVGLQDVIPIDIAFNTDGTKMFIAGTANDNVYQYTLTTGFDLSTASYDSVSFSVGLQDTSVQGITFNTDGTKMFMAGIDGNRIYQYTLTTGFDLSTASYDSVSFDASAQIYQVIDITFNTDGTKMFIVNINDDKVYQYTLTTGFDVSTASYDSVDFDFDQQERQVRSIAFNTDGTKLFMVGTYYNSVYQYTLTTGFDVSTISYDSVVFSPVGQVVRTQGIAFNNDGTKMFILDSIYESVYQYSIPSQVIQKTHTYGVYPQIVSEALYV